MWLVCVNVCILVYWFFSPTEIDCVIHIVSFLHCATLLSSLLYHWEPNGLDQIAQKQVSHDKPICQSSPLGLKVWESWSRYCVYVFSRQITADVMETACTIHSPHLFTVGKLIIYNGIESFVICVYKENSPKWRSAIPDALKIILWTYVPQSLTNYSWLDSARVYFSCSMLLNHPLSYNRHPTWLLFMQFCPHPA